MEKVEAKMREQEQSEVVALREKLKAAEDRASRYEMAARPMYEYLRQANTLHAIDDIKMKLGASYKPLDECLIAWRSSFKPAEG